MRALKSAEMPASRYTKITKGPESCVAGPISTNIPAPIRAPSPSVVAWKKVIDFLREIKGITEFYFFYNRTKQ